MQLAKKRLLVVSPWESAWSLGRGAGVSDDHYFIRGFTAAGYEIHFLVPEGAGNEGPRSEQVQSHTYPNFFHKTRNLPRFVKRLTWLRMFNSAVLPRTLALARSLRPDFVLGHSHYAALITSRCRRDLGIPSGVKLFGVMDLVHTEWPRWKYFFKNFEQIAALRHPQDAWIVLDDGTRGDRVLASRGLPEEKIFFLPNGVNLEWQEETYDRAGARAELGVGDDTSVVLFLARFVASKRPEEVVSIIPRVHEKTGGRVKFVFAGDGPQRASCEALARRLGVSDAAAFIGIVPHADVPRIMAASDLFVTTSSLTNMAIPTCEAFICGLPVAAYDTGDTNKVVVPGETGALAADGDREQLADAVVSLLGDEDGLKRLGNNARRFARDNFTGWDERVRMELDIINRLIS